MTYEELTKRAQQVMREFDIAPERSDLSFLAQIAWVFGYDFDISLKPMKAPEDD